MVFMISGSILNRFLDLMRMRKRSRMEGKNGDSKFSALDY